MQAVMNEADLAVFLEREFPQVTGDFAVERLTDDGIVMRLKVGDRHLRPGGTVSGPNIFALADVAVYLAILARIGPVALAVTTNGSVDFLRKPEAGRDLIGTARLLKLGRVLAVGDVLIRSEGMDEPVARANMTYSIPPKR
ncbi:MAG: PaaI family thioesterase [Albidovulum sp.]|uniref:PaaI family thioesterase n=1 Tax=Albidovulum sp. TaxID=1872424 RepID=UPI003C859DB5